MSSLAFVLVLVITTLSSTVTATQLSGLPCRADATTFHINSQLGDVRDLGLKVTIGLSQNQYQSGGRAVPVTVTATAAFNEFIMFAQRVDLSKAGQWGNLTNGTGFNTDAACNNTTPQSTIWSTTDTIYLGPRLTGLTWTPPSTPGSGTLQFFACIAQYNTSAPSAAGFDCWTSAGYTEQGVTPAAPPTGVEVTIGGPMVTVVRPGGGGASVTGASEAIGGAAGRGGGSVGMWAVAVFFGALGFLAGLV